MINRPSHHKTMVEEEVTLLTETNTVRLEEGLVTMTLTYPNTVPGWKAWQAVTSEYSCQTRVLSEILLAQSAKEWEQCSRTLSSRLSERHEEVVALLQQVKDLKHELKLERHEEVVALLQQVKDLKHELKLERQRSELWEQRAKQAVWGTANE